MSMTSDPMLGATSSPTLTGRRALAGGAVAALLAGVLPAAASGEEQRHDGPPEAPFEITGEILADSVDRFDPEATIRTYERDRAIEELGETESEDEGEDVIVLETDILFTPNNWELPGGAGSRVVELVEEVPDGAEVAVHGHTDSTPVGPDHDFDNQQLSERRAQAVADVLAEERSDLELDVAGFGAEEPAVAEDEQDPSTFAANRRVEIRYGD